VVAWPTWKLTLTYSNLIGDLVNEGVSRIEVLLITKHVGGVRGIYLCNLEDSSSRY
jgi:hypothetical protein